MFLALGLQPPGKDKPASGFYLAATGTFNPVLLLIITNWDGYLLQSRKVWKMFSFPDFISYPAKILSFLMSFSAFLASSLPHVCVPSFLLTFPVSSFLSSFLGSIFPFCPLQTSAVNW
ncbi:hypothetical protein GOODEAATRI_002553 [Goodea atripinnis]|uniref:Uncharacterized protein n=1 Tax=Goodea atripinnis TaxID=208336 RepID=A0ABV0MEU9_9TELE